MRKSIKIIARLVYVALLFLFMWSMLFSNNTGIWLWFNRIGSIYLIGKTFWEVIRDDLKSRNLL